MGKRKYSSAEDLSNESEAGLGFVTWANEEERIVALNESAKAYEEYRMVDRGGSASAGRYRSYKDLDTNVSGRPGLTRRDYEQFRPGESVPSKHSDIIKAANTAYQRVGLIRNIIDLMGDFATQGIRLVHPNKRIEKFYRNWFSKVKGRERSERFLNNLYRTGNVVIRKQTAKINSKGQKELFKSQAEPETEMTFLKISKREIPWKYVFLDPSTINTIGGELASFVGNPRHSIKLPSKLKRIINSPRNDAEKKLVGQLPKEIIQAAASGKAYPLPEDKTLVFHYKKDDWQNWAHPMIYAILDDVMLLEKLKLADVAALDGAISNIRIFKLGNLDHKIAPTAAAASKLANILENHVGGGTTDLVWGPDIELVESKTSVHQFLGQEKYVPTLNSIYAGLGIPPSLTGLSGSSGSFTSNFMSLKTLVERLEYGRSVLVSFWEKEIYEVQKAMGFRFPATVEFDKMSLTNEDSEKSLLIQLADRNLISEETLQRKFGDNPDMEKLRIVREDRDRDRGRRPEKASPYHDANGELGLKKIALQTGIVAPAEVGLELEDKIEGQKSGVEMKEAQTKKTPGPDKEGLPDTPNQGRPKNSKDKSPRESRTVNPITKAVTQAKAKIAQEAISKIVNPLILEMYKKKDLRSLSSTQTDEAESIKFGVLYNLSSLSDTSPKNIHRALSKAIPSDISLSYNNWIGEFVKEIGRKPTLEESRSIQAVIYSESKAH
tara:strand:+ start:810 stop:2972 length:2163 start_codon:yes stop_codon:yes gene_type:complete